MSKIIYEYPSNIKLLLSGGGVNEQYTPNKIGDYPNATFTKDIIIPSNSLYEDITHNIGLHINGVESGLSSNIIVGKLNINFVSFTSTSNMTITPKYTNSGQLQYSTDLINWVNITSGGTTTSSKVIYMKGKMNSATLFTTNSTTNAWAFSNASNLTIKGNLNDLLDYENPPTTILDYCYANMFNSCSSLTDISELELPAIVLAGYCYQSMFNYCTSLISIPSNLLPATTLTSSCYRYMFQNCSNLVVNKAISTGYSRPFRIPSSGTGTTGANSLSNMFYKTAGTMNDSPSINRTFYIKD